MSFTDYLVNGALVALVVLQIRGRRLTVRTLVLPLAIVGVAAAEYLHGIPTSGDDLALVMVGVAAGAVLGTGCGLATTVSRDGDGHVRAKAGPLAAALWVLGVGARLAFAIYAGHGGAAAIGRFSSARHITSGETWVAALILMALVEVVGRTAVLAARYRRLGGSGRPVAPGRAIMELRGRSS